MRQFRNLTNSRIRNRRIRVMQWIQRKGLTISILAGTCLFVFILIVLPLSIVTPRDKQSGGEGKVSQSEQVSQLKRTESQSSIKSSQGKVDAAKGPKEMGTQTNEHESRLTESPKEAAPYVRVYLTNKKKVERVPLEIYVRGVIAAEMPESFELEALKAQAIAARTFIIRRLMHGTSDGVPQGADVIGSVAHQAYEPLEKFAARKEAAQQKLNRAVNETAGLILTYQDKPIQAAYFSTSNGYTENAEEYWASSPVPYLRSVPSPWDRAISPRFTNTVKLDANELLRKLGVSTSDVPAFSTLASDQAAASAAGSRALAESFKVLSRTTGKRLAELSIGGEKITGRQLRERLGLTSSAVEWQWKDGQVVLTSYGYGHGVGMSQYGAQGMALKGSKAEQIVTYYYVQTKLQKIEEVWPA